MLKPALSSNGHPKASYLSHNTLQSRWGASRMSVAIVLTTVQGKKKIRPLVRSYLRNFERCGTEATMLLVGDKKSPRDLESLKGEAVRCVFPEEQVRFLKENNLTRVGKLIPWDSIERRNVGFLIAAIEGYDTIISIDDDNFATVDDFVRGHTLGYVGHWPEVSSGNRWINVCKALRFGPRSLAQVIYSRGYPYSKRFRGDTFVVSGQVRGKVVLNEGLWLGDPDVDAITNLVAQVKVIGARRERLAAKAHHFLTINTQNTSFLRKILPAMYDVHMGCRLDGWRIGRYDDIWMGMFAKKIIDHMGDVVTFGPPLTEHRRNPHDLFADLKAEYWGMILTERLMKFVEDIVVTGNNYADSYIDLARSLAKLNRKGRFGSEPTVVKYLSGLFQRMSVWAEETNRLL